LPVEIRYWDSSCFIAWFMKEQGSFEKCEGVVQAAIAGDVQIVTSALTLAEVVCAPGRSPLPSGLEEQINKFFDERVSVRNVTPFIGNHARHLLWSHQHLAYKDAIHVATAMQIHGITCLDSFDNHMLKMDGKLGSPALKICHPKRNFQPQLQESRVGN
jgi:predicted nucleic acid-binding protein